MPDTWGVDVPDSAIIALAQLMVKRAKLRGMRIDSRKSAIAIIKGLRPAVSKDVPLASVIKPVPPDKKAIPTSLCSACGKPLPIGSLCRTVWTTYEGEHIKCEGKPTLGFIRSKPEDR